jgi:hypothetical protein
MKALRFSAVLTLVALALMVWSVLQPTPLPVMLAMSVGQLLGTIAFALYLYVVLRDLRRRVIRGEAILPPLFRRVLRLSQPIPKMPEQETK